MPDSHGTRLVRFGIYPTNRVMHLTDDRGLSTYCGADRAGRTIVLGVVGEGHARVCKRCERAAAADQEQEDTDGRQP